MPAADLALGSSGRSTLLLILLLGFVRSSICCDPLCDVHYQYAKDNRTRCDQSILLPVDLRPQFILPGCPNLEHYRPMILIKGFWLKNLLSVDFELMYTTS